MRQAEGNKIDSALKWAESITFQNFIDCQNAGAKRKCPQTSGLDQVTWRQRGLSRCFIDPM